MIAAADHAIPHDNEQDSEYEDYSSDEEESTDQGHTKLNDESLLQLKNNDPKLTQLDTDNWNEDSFARKVDWLNYVGTFESNTNLKKLYIDFAREHETAASDYPLCSNASAFGSKLSCIRSVEDLYITDIGEYDDKVFASLAPLFEKSTNLIKISLGDCYFSTKSTRLLASALSKQQNKGSLKCFSLFDAYFGDENDVEKADLITALGDYHSLKNLRIRDGGFQGRECHAALANVIRNPLCNVKRLHCGSTGIDSESLLILLEALTENTSVKGLDLQGHYNGSRLSTLGRDVSIWLQNNSTLQYLDLSYCGITDQDIIALGNALMSNSTLQVLNVGTNRSITSMGWQAFSIYLQNHNSTFKNLKADDTDMNDESLMVLLNALANDTILKTLVAHPNDSISDIGWQALADFLCDKTSLESIYTSNHTLQQIYAGYYYNDDGPKDHLVSLLELNQNGNKHEVARQKLIRYYFSNDDGGIVKVEDFVDMELEVLPYAIAWVGRDDTGHSLLYKLFQTMPTLFDTDSKAKAAGEKRKRV